MNKREDKSVGHTVKSQRLCSALTERQTGFTSDSGAKVTSYTPVFRATATIMSSLILMSSNKAEVCRPTVKLSLVLVKQHRSQEQGWRTHQRVAKRVDRQLAQHRGSPAKSEVTSCGVDCFLVSWTPSGPTRRRVCCGYSSVSEPSCSHPITSLPFLLAIPYQFPHSVLSK